jgi:hypothetical protein
VDLTRRAKKKVSSGFVNAILRSLSRQRHALRCLKADDLSNRDAALDICRRRCRIHAGWRRGGMTVWDSER